VPPFTTRGPQTFAGPRGTSPTIEVILDGQRELLAKTYQVKLSAFSQPAAFSLTLGVARDLADLIAGTPANTAFALRVDGHSSKDIDGNLVIKGRDALAPLHDANMLQEQTYHDDTYAAWFRKVMDDCGLKGTPLEFSNRANRAQILGVDPEDYAYKEGPALAAQRSVEGLRFGDSSATAGGAVKKHIQSQLGETGYEFAMRHIKRAGLFVWAGAKGGLVLSEPNPNQVPIYRIHRSKGAVPEFSTVIGHEYDNDTSRRFSEIHVYPRGETKRRGRSKTVAKVVDSEMLALGFNRPRVLRDVNADTLKKAEFMARRVMAESRREGWKLSYTLEGHSTGSTVGKRVVWAPDTIVTVDDEMLGIREDLWVASVTFTSAPKRCTVVELMRPRDLIFGEGPT
jgi:hypothetical protein